MSAMWSRGQFRNSCVINPTELLRFLSGCRSRSLDAVAVCSLLVGSAEMANQSVPSRSAAAAMTSDFVVFCFGKPEDAEAFAECFDRERLPVQP
jgi:hypothetical protein